MKAFDDDATVVLTLVRGVHMIDGVAARAVIEACRKRHPFVVIALDILVGGERAVRPTYLATAAVVALTPITADPEPLLKPVLVPFRRQTADSLIS